ncbi:MAG: glycosyltransferase family 2 protein [Bacteroidetes bacterium]|nr:glycosyltransferase family 2 protein [Bacteroidota bacterium]
MRIAIAILNWNGKHLLEKFLPDVIKHSPSHAEVYVIDNASTDGSVEFLKSKFTGVNIICNSINYGFAKGYNEGLKNISADYFILLNSDVQVTQNWIEPVISLMEADSTIAACQPKILNYTIRDEFEYAGGGGGFIDKWGYPFCRGRFFDSFEKDNGQYNDVMEIFWASGACLFIRSKIFFEAGKLDEDFFAHMEEIDLCWRMKNMGYKVMYCPHSVVYHVGGGTLSKISATKTFFNFRNNLILLSKNHAPEYFRIKILLRLKMDALAGLKFLFSGQITHCIAVIRAHWNFFGSLGRTLKKRKAMKKRIKSYTSSAVYRKSIVVEYFIRRIKKFSDLDKTYFG